MPIEWLSPEWWAAQTTRGNDHQNRSAVELLAKLQSMLARLPLGEIQAAKFATAAVRRSDVQIARGNIWKFKADLRSLVKPGSILAGLKRRLRQLRLEIAGS